MHKNEKYFDMKASNSFFAKLKFKSRNFQIVTLETMIMMVEKMVLANNPRITMQRVTSIIRMVQSRLPKIY